MMFFCPTNPSKSVRQAFGGINVPDLRLTWAADCPELRRFGGIPRASQLNAALLVGAAAYAVAGVVAAAALAARRVHQSGDAVGAARLGALSPRTLAARLDRVVVCTDGEGWNIVENT